LVVGFSDFPLSASAGPDDACATGFESIAEFELEFELHPQFAATAIIITKKCTEYRSMASPLWDFEKT